MNTRLVLIWPASKNPEDELEFEYDIRTDCEEKALLDRAEISLGSNLSIGRRLAIVLVVVVVLRPRSGIARFARWKEDERRKQALGVSLLPPEKRPRTKDDDEDEDDWEMTLNTYRHEVPGLGIDAERAGPGGTVEVIVSPTDPMNMERAKGVGDGRLYLAFQS